MSRIRSVHPKIWTDERFILLSDKARLLLLAIGTYSDYANRFPLPSLMPLAEHCGWAWDSDAYADLFVSGLLSQRGQIVTVEFSFGHPRLHVSRWEAIRSAVFERDSFACTYCGDTELLHCDHIIPKSRGGSDEMENLTTACRGCNLSKGDKTPEEWRASQQ